MTTLAACRAEAQKLDGSRLKRVDYLLLAGEWRTPGDWDYETWHWPECVVEIETLDGRVFCATWDYEVVQFELNFSEGPASRIHIPARDGSEYRVNVSEHPAWKPLMGVPVEVMIIPTGPTLSAAESDRDDIPIAVRIAANGKANWIASAMPQMRRDEPFELTAKTVYFGGDEIIVILGDTFAEALGLPEPPTPGVR